MRALALLTLTLVVAGLAGSTARASAPTTASNRRAAERDVAALLQRFVTPTGVRPLTFIPPKARWWLRSKWVIPPHVADRHHLWRIDASARSVVAFVREHRPRGAKVRLDNSTQGTAHVLPSHHFVLDFRAMPGRIWARELFVAVVPLRKGVTALRVDAQDVWIWTQAARDRLPGGVREIELTRVRWLKHAGLSKRVTNRSEIRRIAGWVRALEVVPPRTGCPWEPPAGARTPPVTISFRGKGGSTLARIRILSSGIGRTPACHAMGYSVRGRVRPALVAGSFPARLARLLRVRLY